MNLIANGDKFITHFRSNNYLQETTDTDWCGYQPIIQCTLNNIFNGTVVKDGLLCKLISDEKYTKSTALAVIENKLTEFNVPTGTYQNLSDSYFSSKEFNNTTNGEYLNTEILSNEVKLIEFNFMNLQSGDCFFFGSSEENKYLQFGRNLDNTFGIGFGSSPITEDPFNINLQNDIYIK